MIRRKRRWQRQLPVVKLQGPPHWVWPSCGDLARIDAGVSSACGPLTGMRTAGYLIGIEGSFPNIIIYLARATDVKLISAWKAA